MNEYEVTVVRKITQLTRIKVEAKNKSDAKSKAVKKAKNKNINWILGSISGQHIAVNVKEI